MYGPDTRAECFLIDAGDQARDSWELGFGESFPEELVKSATADSWTDRNAECLGIPLCDTRPLTRQKNEAVLFSRCQCDCLGLSSFEEETEGMDGDFFPFFNRILSHAVQETLDMILFFGTGEIARETDDNRVLSDECTRMLVARPFDTVSGGAVFHGEGAVYDRRTPSSTYENCKNFVMFSGYFMVGKSRPKRRSDGW